MDTAYIVAALLAVAANTIIATLDIAGSTWVLTNMARVGLPESSLTVLGILKVAGVVRLLLSLIGVPMIGMAAAIGLVLFYVGAIMTHVKTSQYASIGFPAVFLLLASTTLALDLGS